MDNHFEMTEGKLAVLSIIGVSLGLSTVIQWLQVGALTVSIIAGILAIRKHFKK